MCKKEAHAAAAAADLQMLANSKNQPNEITAAIWTNIHNFFG